MSSGLGLLASNPGLYYAPVGDVSGATYYTVNSTTGVWSSATDVDFTGVLLKDLGKIVYYHPTNSVASPATAPPVDVRKVALVTNVGVTQTTYYIPVGTRVRGLKTQQTSIPSCWVAQTASGVAQ